MTLFSEVYDTYRLFNLSLFLILWPAVPCDLVDPSSATFVLTDEMSGGTDTEDWSDALVSFECVRRRPVDEAVQAIYIGKNVRLLTTNMTVTNAVTSDSASGPHCPNEHEGPYRALRGQEEIPRWRSEVATTFLFFLDDERNAFTRSGTPPKTTDWCTIDGPVTTGQ